MKFGKNLIQVADLSNPEWGQYWINYKYLKRKINEIIEHRPADQPIVHSSDPKEISKNAAEVEFFILVRKELKKTTEFFKRCQEEFTIRWERVWGSYLMLQEKGVVHDKNTWTRLLMACVRFYKDVLLLENFAIINYCGFSKILKKHDKVTGFITRDAFMRNVMNSQNITHYPMVLELIRKSEQLFHNIQTMDSVMPLQDDERLFIDAIRDMNYQASRMQAEESTSVAAGTTNATNTASSHHGNDDSTSSTSDSVAKLAQLAQLAASHPLSPETPTYNKPILPPPPAISLSHAAIAALAVAPVIPPATFYTNISHYNDLLNNNSYNNLTNSNTNNSSNSSSDNKSDKISNGTTSAQLSDRLDHATTLAVEAAMRLNCHNAPPDVPLALSWMHRIVNPAVAAAASANSSNAAAATTTTTITTTTTTNDSNSDSKSSVVDNNSTHNHNTDKGENATTSLRRPLSDLQNNSNHNPSNNAGAVAAGADGPDSKRSRTT